MPEPAAGPERRLHVRFGCPRPVGASVASPDFGPRARPARIVNLSRGGLALLLDEPLPVGTALAVEVEGWAGGRPLLARVVHTSDRVAGWMHGCQLADPLNPADFLDLLDRIAPDDGVNGRPGP